MKIKTRRSIHALVLLLLACVFCGSIRAQPPGALDDHGLFDITLHGQPVGSERFEIRSNGEGVTARAETSLSLNGVHYETTSNMILSAALDPLVYRWTQSAPRKSSLQISFGPDGANARYNTVRGRRDRRQFNLPPDAVILDDNAVHQYEIAAMRYDISRGGAQTFHAFIPQEALPGSVTITSGGSEGISVGNGRETCRHLILTTDLARVDLWVDGKNHLQKMEIDASGLVAERAH